MSVLQHEALVAASLDYDFISEQEASTGISIDTVPSDSRDTSDKYIFIPYGGEEANSKSHLTKYTPRLILTKNKIYYNWNKSFDLSIRKDMYGSVIVRSEDSTYIHRISYLYGRSVWQRGGHFQFDIYKNSLVYHAGNSITYNQILQNGYSTGSIKSIDYLHSKVLDTVTKSKPENFSSRHGFLSRAFQNRQNGDSLNNSKVTLTNDSIGAEALLKESWYDFHIDKKGRTHAFVYLRGELIYLQQKKPTNNPDVNTWQENFSIPATDDIGPFTTVTVKGKQYLFTQNGTILKNTGKTMTEVGKLPGDLRNTSVVWDKEKDKMWYITKEEFDAYKAGDSGIIQRMNPIPLEKR